MHMKRVLIGAALVIAACTKDVSGPSPAPACTPGGPSSLTLPVGGVAVLSDPQSLACVLIAAAPSATSYLFVAANALPKNAGPSAYRVEAAVEGTGVSAAVSTARAVQTVSPQEPPTRDQALEIRLREMERQMLTLSAARTFWQGARAQAARAAPAAVPVLGDSLNLGVPDASSTTLCTHYFTVRAVVKAVGAHGIVVQDTAAPAGGFTAADFAAISNEVDSFTYPTDTSYFGRPTDLDNDGHVFILYTPRVNALTKRGSTSFFGGFFFGGDLFPRTGTGGCAESNVGEIFYLLAPDPTGVFSDARQTTVVRQETRSTIPHELEHMVNPGVRIVDSTSNPTITPGSLSTCTRALGAGPDSGPPNLTARGGVPFDSLMAGWMLAICADGLGIPGLSSRYGFLSWDFHDAETSGGLGPYPLRITALAGGSDVTAMARPGSGNYFLLSSSPTTPAGMFRLLSPTGSLVSFLGARLYVLRTQ